jgi:hypothetical protein
MLHKMALIAKVTSPHNAGGPQGSKRGGKDQCFDPQVDVLLGQREYLE